MKLISQPNFQNAYQISNKLCLVESKSIKAIFNKPIYFGACILDMYQFWYDHLKEQYKVELIYTDTDSFIIQVETNDVYKDMLENKILYDFSDYPINHLNYDITNKKVLGKFKDELNSLIITEFIGFKPKMYSFGYIDNNIKINKCNKCEYDEYNNIIINENDKRIILKYDEYNNIVVNNNIHKGIKKSTS